MYFNVKEINWLEFKLLLLSRGSAGCSYLPELVFDAVEKREHIHCEIIYFNYSIVKNLLK